MKQGGRRRKEVERAKGDKDKERRVGTGNEGLRKYTKRIQKQA